MDNYEKIRNILDNVQEDNIKFKKHFHERTKDRPVDEELIKQHIKKTDLLLKVEEQERRGETVYRLRFHLSSKYDLVIIVKIAGEGLYILTAWSTSRKWQKAMQK